jgi:hypothetical protein
MAQVDVFQLHTLEILADTKIISIDCVCNACAEDRTDDDPEVRKAAEASVRKHCSVLQDVFVRELGKVFCKTTKYRIIAEEGEELRSAVMLYRAVYSSPLIKDVRTDLLDAAPNRPNVGFVRVRTVDDSGFEERVGKKSGKSSKRSGEALPVRSLSVAVRRLTVAIVTLLLDRDSHEEVHWIHASHHSVLIYSIRFAYISQTKLCTKKYTQDEWFACSPRAF